MDKITTKLVWEFEADVSGIDPKCVDIKGFAKELAFRELQSQIDNGDITEEDFDIVSESE